MVEDIRGNSRKKAQRTQKESETEKASQLPQSG
jgi:hypothetical protein